MLIFVVKPKDNLEKITTILNEAFLVLPVLTANVRFFCAWAGFWVWFFPYFLFEGIVVWSTLCTLSERLRVWFYLCCLELQGRRRFSSVMLKTIKVLWNSAFISGSLNCKEMWIVFFFPLCVSAVLMYNRGVWWWLSIVCCMTVFLKFRKLVSFLQTYH